jgi:hypothetical protein
MNREIKFRIWDGKEMRERPPLNEWEMEDGEFWVENCDNPIMQYTGLKDKNGKEIYEGDILAGSPSWECQRATVQWKHGGFVKYGLYNSGWTDTPLLDGLGRFEVIGNIHEHQSLIPAT